MQARQVRKKRPAPADEEEDEDDFDAAGVAAEMAEDDARELVKPRGGSLLFLTICFTTISFMIPKFT